MTYDVETVYSIFLYIVFYIGHFSMYPFHKNNKKYYNMERIIKIHSFVCT